MVGFCSIAASTAAREWSEESPCNRSFNPEGYYQRAMLYLEMGEADSALADFKTTAKIAPRHIDALLRVAAIYHEREDFQEAEVAWRKVLDAVGWGRS